MIQDIQYKLMPLTTNFFNIKLQKGLKKIHQKAEPIIYMLSISIQLYN